MISGLITLAPMQEYEVSDVQSSTLGSLAVTVDGKVVQYCLAGSVALLPGKLCQGPAVVANHQNIAVASTAAIGDITVTVTLGATAATANQYAGGFLSVNDATGEGAQYEILSHPAADASASLVVTLRSPIRVALVAATSEVSLIANPANGIIVNPTTPTGKVVGVPIVDVPASYYCWVVMKGLCPVLNDGALTVGSAVSPSNAVAGAVENGVIAQGFVGNAYQTGVDTEYRTVNLNIS